MPTGKDIDEEVHNSLQEILREAQTQDISPNVRQQFKSLIFEFKDIVRTRIGSDPSADIAPMKIALKENSKPVWVRMRRYSPLQANFLRIKVDKLRELGLVRRNSNS